MQRIYWKLLTFCFVMLACHSSTQKTTINTVNTTILEKVKSVKDSFIKYSVDTANYAGIPYYDTVMQRNGSKGYVDTFNIHNAKFRVIHQDTLFNGMVEVNKNAQWVRLMQFDNLGNYNNYDVSQDFDGDGYNDLIFYWRWNCDIYFFDSTKNEFSDTANATIGIDWTLLDKKKHIYFENNFGKLMDSPVSSILFILKNGKRTDIAILNITLITDEDVTLIKGRLFSVISNKLIETIVPRQKTSVLDFNYQKFWQQRCKKLLLLCRL